MKTTMKRIRALVITVIAVAATNYAVSFASGVPLPDSPKPKSGVPLPDSPKPKSGVPLPDSPKPRSGVPLPDSPKP